MESEWSWHRRQQPGEQLMKNASAGRLGGVAASSKEVGKQSYCRVNGSWGRINHWLPNEERERDGRGARVHI